MACYADFMHFYDGNFMKCVRTLIAAISSLLLASCSGLHTAKQTPAKLLEQTRSSIITSRDVSAATRSLLLSSGLNQESCLTDIAACTHALQSGSLNGYSRSLLSSLAELSYAKSVQLSQDPNCRPELDRPPVDEYYTNAPVLETQIRQKKAGQDACLSDYRHALYQTLRYSYAYLFFHKLTSDGVSTTWHGENDVRTQDLYHLAVNDIITELYRSDHGAFATSQRFLFGMDKPTIEPVYQQVSFVKLISQEQDQPTALTLSIENDPYYLTKLLTDGQNAFSDLVSAYDSRLTKLDVNARRQGVGTSFVGSVNDRYTANLGQKLQSKATPSSSPIDRIHRMGHVLLTAVIIPQGETLEAVLHSHEFQGYFFNPERHRDIQILGETYPLAANFSAGYALWLSENQLQPLSILNMLAKKDHIALPELFMLKPYNPDQKVIIMLHGLASSPATWVNLTNSLLADNKLNENYQVWQIAYSTNLPILENRHQINELIQSAFQSVDPTGKDVASQNAILIGHSMGGVISRLLVSDASLMPIMATLENRDQRKLINPLTRDERQALESRMNLQRLAQVDTAVFLSAPFRGTDYADRWFTRAARRIIHLPIELTKTVGSTLSAIGNDDQSVLGSLYLQNGASQLSDRSSFVALTKDVQIHPRVRYHTIMGDNKGIHQAGDSISDKLSDGIVPYSSSHLDGAASETIITGSHNIHENPKTILQLRKILYEHVENLNNHNK